MTTFCIVAQSGKIYFVRAAASELASNFIMEVGHDPVICCTEQRAELPRGASVFEI